MTPRQIDIVQNSFAALAPYGEAFAQAFYARLFQLDQGLQGIFSGDIPAQAAKLMQMLDVVVHGLSRPADLASVLRSLGERHGGYGVRRCDFDTLAQALNDGLRARFGDAFDAELQQAWHLALRFTTDHMVAGMLARDTEPRSGSSATHVDVVI
jgi:hemoglobin-like flavoprotein